MTTPCVPVSWGELLDKITILEIRLEHLRAPEAIAHVRRELALLLAALPEPSAALEGLRADLRAVNHRLWDIEDAIRRKEAVRTFDAGFIELARSVYHTNDERSRIKREINTLLGSDIVEEKHYAGYR